MKNNLFLIALLLTQIACNRSTPISNNDQPLKGPKYSEAHQKIFDQLKEADKALFDLVFNHCDTAKLKSLISKDFEFYHDQDGFIPSRSVFLNGVPNLCKMNYKASRVVIDNSLSIHPLYNRGKLYAAIQKGKHQFWGEEAGKPKYLTSTAVFTHLWVLENDKWKLKRVLSYDHQTP